MDRKVWSTWISAVTVRHRLDGGTELGFSRLWIAMVCVIAFAVVMFGAVGLRTWSIVPMSEGEALVSGLVMAVLLAGGIAGLSPRMTLGARSDALTLPRIGRRTFRWSQVEELRWSPDTDALLVHRTDGDEIECDLSVFGALRRSGPPSSCVPRRRAGSASASKKKRHSLPGNGRWRPSRST